MQQHELNKENQIIQDFIRLTQFVYPYKNEPEIGLRFSKYGRIEVTNMKVFMLATIKYGIQFKEYSV
jgi:hypothetical protein